MFNTQTGDIKLVDLNFGFTSNYFKDAAYYRQIGLLGEALYVLYLNKAPTHAERTHTYDQIRANLLRIRMCPWMQPQ
jgi:hypothetical protein